MTISAEQYFWNDNGTYDQIGDQVTAYIKEHRSISIEYKDLVYFSAYGDDYENNLNDIAVEGRMVFIEEETDYSERYVSPVLENPTWIELCLRANDMINKTGDLHHVFLENIEINNSIFTVDEKSFVKVYRFIMGS